MATVLNKEIRRALVVAGKTYIVTISPVGLKIVEKGRRKGREIPWTDLVSGDFELQLRLQQSLASPGKERAG